MCKCTRIDVEEDSGFIKHAKRELVLLGYDLNEKEEGPNKWIVENVLELLSVMSRQGHSGFSASYLINLFSKLAKYQICSPLTGKDDEWIDVAEMNGGNILYQNNRDSRVFKDKDGAYFIDGFVFIDEHGCTYTNRRSRVKIKSFPYIPKTEYINVGKYNGTFKGFREWFGIFNRRWY